MEKTEPEPNERASRIFQLAQHILAASRALEQGDWRKCDEVLLKASRECRMLVLLEKQETQERAE